MPRKKSQSFSDDNIEQAKHKVHENKHLKRYQSYDAHTAPPVPVLDVPEGQEGDPDMDPVYLMLRRLGGRPVRSEDSADTESDPQHSPRTEHSQKQSPVSSC